MADANDPFSPNFAPPQRATPAGGQAPPAQPSSGAPAPRSSAPPAAAASTGKGIPVPPEPEAFEQLDLGEVYMQDLILKCVNVEGAPRAIDIAHHLCVPYRCIERILDGLKERQFLQVVGGGAAFGKQTMSFSLTAKGSERVFDNLRRDNYYGPAPVQATRFFEQIHAQSINNVHITPEKVKEAFGKLILDKEVVDRMGPAINSAKSIFLYGPPGNGKTSLAECITETIGGEIYVPHAIMADSQIVKLYDPLYHEKIESPEGERAGHDPRWVKCKRPIVMVGGELTLETLDLVRTAEATYYEAPFQMKAANGVLFIDDFGRQKCDPQDLLNRWIVPLESRFDFLTFHGGQKMRVPFDSLLVFSTNLDPKQLVDDAFLRRIRYKILVDNPSEENFRAIWHIMCKIKKVEDDPAMLDYLIDNHYRDKRPFRACQPRDLLEQFLDIAKFYSQASKLTPEVIDRLCSLYFVEL